MNALRGCTQLGRPEGHPPTRNTFIMIILLASHLIRRSSCWEVYINRSHIILLLLPANPNEYTARLQAAWPAQGPPAHTRRIHYDQAPSNCMGYIQTSGISHNTSAFWIFDSLPTATVCRLNKYQQLLGYQCYVHQGATCISDPTVPAALPAPL